MNPLPLFMCASFSALNLAAIFGFLVLQNRRWGTSLVNKDAENTALRVRKTHQRADAPRRPMTKEQPVTRVWHKGDDFFFKGWVPK
jgi:hypothetical protein